MKTKTLIEQIAASRGVKACFVWQPVPSYKYEIEHHPFSAGIGRHWLCKFGYERLAEIVKTNPQPKNFLWCADMQEGLREPLYVDALHYSPAMSDRFASEIARKILESGLIP